MITYEYSYRVGYADTDQMGYMHHSNYIKIFESARWELLRSIDISYKSLEDAGYMLPVVDLNCKYLYPAKYDDVLLIETKLIQIIGPRILFAYNVFNAEKKIISLAETTLAFIQKENRRPCHPPERIMDVFHHQLNIGSFLSNS